MSKPSAQNSKEKESKYLLKLEDDESEKESDVDSESYEEDESLESDDIDESENSQESQESEKEDESLDSDVEEDIEDVDSDSGSEKAEQEDVPLEWIDNSVLEKTDKIILTGDKRIMSDRVTMNEFALIVAMRIAQIEAGSPIFLDNNPYIAIKDIVLAEIRENANNKGGNYPLKIIRHSHSNIYEEWLIREMSIPTIVSSGTIIETGDDE